MQRQRENKETLPEESVVFDADFPQPFSSAVIRELEPDGALELLKLKEKI